MISKTNKKQIEIIPYEPEMSEQDIELSRIAEEARLLQLNGFLKEQVNRAMKVKQELTAQELIDSIDIQMKGGSD